MTEQNTGWQPEDLRKLACDAVKHLKEEREALQARCDKLEAAAREFFEAYSSGKPMATRARLFASLRSVVDGGE